MESVFIPFDLKLIEPEFNSNLIDLIIEFDYLRKKRLIGTTIPQLFFQLKDIFHFLESIGSARIEGNNTTISEYIETKLEKRLRLPPNIKEIFNIEQAMYFVEHNKNQFNRAFFSEIHKIIVKDLSPPPEGEGDLTPGTYRGVDVGIKGSPHKPPSWIKVEEYMEELSQFIHQEDAPKYDLLKVAIAHHRLVWIHPFRNGNGRTVRVFTYAMLLKMGFNVDMGGRILNPTAVFCNDRDAYYSHLANADNGEKNGILNWCEYVLGGLRNEIEKIDKLLDYKFLSKEILLPAVNISLERKLITDIEAKILRKAVEKQVIQANDLTEIFKGKKNTEVSRQIRKLLDKKMLITEGDRKRKYIINFGDNYLLRGIISALDKNGFLPTNYEIK